MFIIATKALYKSLTSFSASKNISALINIHERLNKNNPSNYLDRELHTSCEGSPVSTCARGVRGSMLPPKIFDKIGVIWRILSVPKLVIINLEINIFLDNKSTSQILCHIFLQDQSRCLL